MQSDFGFHTAAAERLGEQIKRRFGTAAHTRNQCRRHWRGASLKHFQVWLDDARAEQGEKIGDQKNYGIES